MHGLQHLNRALVVGLALAATFAVTAHASTRPDDRAGTHGVGAQVTGQAPAVRPDDRAGTLGIGTQESAIDDSDVISRYLSNHAAVTRPDDRAGPLGVGTDVVSGDPQNHPSATRPDDRAGYRGVGPIAAATPAPDGSGFSWDVVGFAAGSSLGALALALAWMALLHRRRSTTAALQS